MAPQSTAAQAPAAKFTVDISGPVSNSIFDAAAYQTFLSEHIKVENKLGNLQGLTLSSNDKVLKLDVAKGHKFSKRYLKYLTKKYLAKAQLREWIRVVSVGKVGYKLSFYDVRRMEAEAEA